MSQPSKPYVLDEPEDHPATIISMDPGTIAVERAPIWVHGRYTKEQTKTKVPDFQANVQLGADSITLDSTNLKSSTVTLTSTPTVPVSHDPEMIITNPIEEVMQPESATNDRQIDMSQPIEPATIAPEPSVSRPELILLDSRGRIASRQYITEDYQPTGVPIDLQENASLHRVMRPLQVQQVPLGDDEHSDQELDETSDDEAAVMPTGTPGLHQIRAAQAVRNTSNNQARKEGQTGDESSTDEFASFDATDSPSVSPTGIHHSVDKAPMHQHEHMPVLDEDEDNNNEASTPASTNNISMTDAANMNLNPSSMYDQYNPEVVERQYRLQYPHLTDDQVNQATRAFMILAYSGFKGKIVHDKSTQTVNKIRLCHLAKRKSNE